VAVVGGGIAGLAAAWELATASIDGSFTPDVHVFEAENRLGGKLQSAEFGGRTVDLAADAFLARRPEATDLCAELGLTGALVPVGATGASLWARGRLRAMPAGLNLGVPTRWWPMARSGVLSVGESLRVAQDLVAPHARTKGLFGDQSVGRIVEKRLGRAVVERLVDPLVGGINAGGVDDLSAAASFPVLLASAHQSGSLMGRLGKALTASTASASASPGPVFWSLTGSTASLAGELTGALTRLGVHFHTGTTVTSLRSTSGGPSATGWRLGVGDLGDPETFDADALVLAVPAPVAAALLRPHTPGLADLLAAIDYASVTVITTRWPTGAVTGPLTGTGFLVPRTTMISDTPALTTGCTYLSRKWPHLDRPDDELIRFSVGRFGDTRHELLDDDELIDAVLAEATQMLQIDGTPSEAMVTRWPAAFPQYRVGHLLRVSRVERELADIGSVAVAGAANRGVGIPACIGSGRGAAGRVLTWLAGQRSDGDRPHPEHA
jgi:protoporphyrinogen/coproporphyrinogen III oxidase